MRILMVCLGNICRSPLAEGILTHKLAGTHHKVASAGTIDYHRGNSPDKRSIEIANLHKVDIQHQKSRPIELTDLDHFDLIFAMDTQNEKDILKICQTEAQRQKVKLILNECFPKENRSVPDPYYGGSHGFKQVYEMLDIACDAVIENYGL